MATVGLESNSNQSKPLWLLAELTYRCPLQCPYCSNPVEMAKYKNELTTEDWIRVMQQARKMGATQLGFSGGEPLVRKDLEDLIKEARRLGYYTNLITSGVGMDEARIVAFKEAGLDHIQISFQASNEELNNYIGGSKSFQHKYEMARLVKKYEYPMVLNIVLHRKNIEQGLFRVRKPFPKQVYKSHLRRAQIGPRYRHHYRRHDEGNDGDHADIIFKRRIRAPDDPGERHTNHDGENRDPDRHDGGVAQYLTHIFSVVNCDKRIKGIFGTGWVRCNASKQEPK